MYGGLLWKRQWNLVFQNAGNFVACWELLPAEEGLCFVQLVSQLDSTVRRRQRCLLKAVQKNIERVVHFFSNLITDDEQITRYVVPLCTRHLKHDRRNVSQRRTNHCWEKKYVTTSKGKLIFLGGNWNRVRWYSCCSPFICLFLQNVKKTNLILFHLKYRILFLIEVTYC